MAFSHILHLMHNRDSFRKLMSQFPFLRLPLELRLKIYRHVLISDIVYPSRTHLWRPVAADSGIFQIGYFTQNSVIPLLLANHQIYAEAAPVLYGENIFVVHVSGLTDEPLAFFERLLERRHLRLLKKVYVRTGYYIREELSPWGSIPIVPVAVPGDDRMMVLGRDVAISARLVRQAWPKSVDVKVDCDAVCRGDYELEEVEDLCGMDRRSRWAYSSWHLWKMFVYVSDSGKPVIEFRRIVSNEPNEFGGRNL